MRTSPAVAKSYAKALFELARERQQAAQVEGELERAAALVTEDRALGAVLGRPWISPANKRRLAEEIGQRIELSKLGRDFLGLVAAGAGRITSARSPWPIAAWSTPSRGVSARGCARRCR